MGELKGLKKGLAKAAPWLELVDFLLKYKRSIHANRAWKHTVSKVIYGVNGMATSLFKQWWVVFTAELLDHMRADLLEESAKYIEVLENQVQHDTKLLLETESRFDFLSDRLAKSDTSKAKIFR